MSWHHIIPFSLLREVWNRIVDQVLETQMPEARTAGRQYLQLADRLIPGVDQLIDRIHAENPGQRRAGHFTLTPLSDAECLMVATAAMWPVWNAVEGPQNRNDDPRDYYFDRFTSGLRPDELVRMRHIETLYEAFRQFTAVPRPNAGAFQMLTATITTARTVVACDQPIRFRPELWVQHPGGMWSKRRDGAPGA